MTEFILRAHGAPTEADKFLGAIGTDAHIEYLAQIIINTLFVSKGHRSDVTLTLVLEKSQDFSRAISIPGSAMGDLGGMTESALLSVIADSLRMGRSLQKEEAVLTTQGISVSATSFEHLVTDRLNQKVVYLLSRKGDDVRGSKLDADSVFLLTDHIPMPKNLEKSLVRKGAKRLSLGPRMLHASQCVVLVQNEIDRL